MEKLEFDQVCLGNLCSTDLPACPLRPLALSFIFGIYRFEATEKVKPSG